MTNLDVREYFPEYDDEKLEHHENTWRKKLQVRVIQQNAALESVECLEIFAEHATWKHRKATQKRGKR